VTPREFIEKWRAVELKERSAAQSHFNDLCALLGEPDPVTADPKGEWFTFEKGATKTAGGEGWADVWRRGCFAWEYKGRQKDLDKAFAQLLRYAIALENPPLLIVSDMDRFRVHTNWTNTVQHVYQFTIDDLADAATRDILKAAFTDPDRLKPAKTRQTLTEEAAEKFARLALRDLVFAVRVDDGARPIERGDAQREPIQNARRARRGRGVEVHRCRGERRPLLVVVRVRLKTVGVCRRDYRATEGSPRSGPRRTAVPFGTALTVAKTASGSFCHRQWSHVRATSESFRPADSDGVAASTLQSSSRTSRWWSA
jgi:hypothetical protein